jgi:hypothetical protein
MILDRGGSSTNGASPGGHPVASAGLPAVPATAPRQGSLEEQHRPDHCWRIDLGSGRRLFVHPEGRAAGILDGVRWPCYVLGERLDGMSTSPRHAPEILEPRPGVRGRRPAYGWCKREAHRARQRRSTWRLQRWATFGTVSRQQSARRIAVSIATGATGLLEHSCGAARSGARTPRRLIN